MNDAAKQLDWEILLVEDDIDSRSLLSSVLESHGMQVIVAESAEEGLLKLETFHPTLVIVDLGLPDMDGWGLMSIMRSRNAFASIPTVAITAYHSNRVAQKAIEAGFIAYFPKPITLSVFVDELESIVYGHA